MNGLFLEKPGLLKEALTREEEWCAQVPGYNATIGDRNRSPMSSLEKSLYKLRAERELGEWAGQFIDPNAPVEDDGSDGNAGLPMQMIYEDQVWEGESSSRSSSSSSDSRVAAVILSFGCLSHTNMSSYYCYYYFCFPYVLRWNERACCGGPV